MSLLKLGARGEAVRDLQQLLARKDPSVVVDQVFGQHTEAAVRRAQHRLGLFEDGVAGPQTMTALRNEALPAVMGKPEPDKSAMAKPIDKHFASDDLEIIPPPNARTLSLLDTARSISEIIFHCTATPEGKAFTVDDVRAWHKARGWTDVGYHYLIDFDGTIYLGRPVGQIGSHVAGRNTGTIGVAYFGGLTADGKAAKDTRTPAQRSSMLWLRDQLMAKHKDIRKLSGHNEYAAKACPCFSVPADPLGRIGAGK